MNDKILKKLNAVAKLYNIDPVLSYEIQNGSQNSTYMIDTNQGQYIIKEYNKDSISNQYNLNKRKEQIRISKELNNRNIKCIIPIQLKKKYFNLFNKKYYLLYKYEQEKSLELKDLTNDHIIKLAKTQCKIHKLNIDTTLPCTYKKINISFSKILRKYQKEPDVYNVLLKNRTNIESLIELNNMYLKTIKNNLCLSHNDYKPQNILWDKINPILIDFDAVGKVNPTCAFCESAYTFSKLNKRVDFARYKLYLETCVNNYKIKDNFYSALVVSMNGKLKWYQYLLSKRDFYGIVSMTNELSTYYKNIDKFNNIYNEIKRG